MDAYVGQSGFEAAFEQYLHGTDGVKLTTVDTKGNVVAEYFQTQPQAGANVESTRGRMPKGARWWPSM